MRSGPISVTLTGDLAALEPAETLKRRIEEASRHLPLEQLAISPQCGFGAADPDKATLTEDEQWNKLERLLETARDVWGNA